MVMTPRPARAADLGDQVPDPEEQETRDENDCSSDWSVWHPLREGGLDEWCGAQTRQRGRP
jgi:hypothetical protein